MKWMVTFSAAFAFGLVLALAWPNARAQQALLVDYYYIPHCMSCARVLQSLTELSREVGERVDIRTTDCFSDAGKAAVEKYGFVTHGVVIIDPRRGVIFEEKDHDVSGDDVRVVVRRELAAAAP